jgi:hypothetical protein
MNNQSMLIDTPIVKVDVKSKKLKYGFDLNQYKIVNKKIRRGDTFGSILENNGIDYPEVYNILQSIKNKVSVRRLVAGKSYSLFYSKDSISTPKAFVYEPQVESFTLVQLRDSVYGKKVDKPINRSKSRQWSDRKFPL